MKNFNRLISLLLVLVIVFLSMVTAVAENTEDEFDVSNYKYYDKVKELNYGQDPYIYSEVYYHYSAENAEEPDWAFICCVTDTLMFDVRFGVAIEDIFIYGNDTGSISDSHYLVYVTSLDEFLRVDSRDIDKILEYCPNFVDIMKEQKLCALRGDINDDFKVDIVDATYAQRFIAGYNDSVKSRSSVHSTIYLSNSIREKGYIVTIDNENNKEWVYHLILDYDCDGEVTVFDATAIQMKLAKIDYLK